MERVVTGAKCTAKTYYNVRQQTVSICEPLITEDHVVQPIVDVSPPKWHLAHTTWFFEIFILKPNLADYQLFNPLFQYLFNSYYQGIGNPYPRIKRGLLSRPTVKSIYQYRDSIDKQVIELIDSLSEDLLSLLKDKII